MISTVESFSESKINKTDYRQHEYFYNKKCMPIVLSGRYLTCTKETIRFVVFFIFWNLQWTNLLSELRKCHPGRRDGIFVSPTTQNSKVMAHKSFFRTYISFSNKMLRFFLKKTTPKFEGHWRKICDGPTGSTSNDISNTNKDCWQLDLPKTARSRCVTPNHLHFPNQILLICGNFSVHKKWKNVWILVLETNWREELWVQLNHFSFGKK